MLVVFQWKCMRVFFFCFVLFCFFFALLSLDTRAGVFMWEDFQSSYQELGRKNPDRATSQPAFSYEHIKVFQRK